MTPTTFSWLQTVNAILVRNGDAVMTAASFNWLTLLNALANVGNWVSIFRSDHTSYCPSIPEVTPALRRIESFSINDLYAGLNTDVHYKLKNIVVNIPALDVCNQQLTFTITAVGIAASNKVYTVSVLANATTGRLDPDELLHLSQYQVFTIDATANVSPSTPPANVTVHVTTEFEAS
jgi:hypothetical protein